MSLSEDVGIYRDWLFSLAAVPADGLWVDFGCGTGADTLRLAADQPQLGLRILGIDNDRAAVEEARRNAGRDPRIEFRQQSLDQTLPIDDESVDVAYSNNLIECLPDISMFVNELARVMRPRGQLIMAHWDWDSQLFNGSDKCLNRRLMHAFCDWKQGWMAHADGWMGRRLWAIFNSSGFFDGVIRAHVLTNSTFSPECFGYARAHDMARLVHEGLASAEDVQTFLTEQTALNASRQYFYSLTGFAYVGRLRAGL